MVYLLWIIIVAGGAFMAQGAIRTQLASGFDLALTLNAVLYLGCTLYGLPRLFRAFFPRS